MISRSQRLTAMRLCNRHVSDDGTSIRVGCSHVGWRPNPEIKSGHQIDCC